MADIFERYQQGLTFGRGIRAENEQRQNQSRLSELAQAAYGAPDQASREAAIGGAIGIDPNAGFQLANQTQGLEDRKRKALVESAGFLGRLPAEQQAQAYAGIRGRLAQAFPDIQLPEDWAQAAPTVQAINQSYGPSQNLGDRFRTVGNSLIDLNNPNQPVFTSPEAKYFEGEDGVYQATPEGLRRLPVAGGQAPQGAQAPPNAPASSALNPTQDFAALGQQFGIQPTSTLRTPERNAEVGGVSNSFHLTGQASDWAVPPAQKSAFIAEAQRRGYQAIDEGDHVHLEPPGSPSASAGQGVTAQSGFRPKGASAAERRLQLAEDSARRQAEAAERSAGATERTANTELAKGEQALRKEVSDRIKDQRVILGAYDKVKTTAGSPSAANDLALIFSYMKMLDPGSVVREGEFANAQNAAGVPDQVVNVYNRAISGERLNPAQRQQFTSSAKQIADSAQAQIDGIRTEYHEIAEAAGYDPFRATGLRKPQPALTATTRQQPAFPKDKADFDRLPSGSVYINPRDGLEYRKP